MIVRRVGRRDHTAPTEAVDTDAAMDAQNAPTAAWKSRTRREIPTAPTAIIVCVQKEDSRLKATGRARPHYQLEANTG